MISHLRIEGMAIIDQLSIDFNPGFNVITGETGAGKSILIRAINFLTGARASVDVLRKGAQQAVVMGEFHAEADHPVVGELKELGILVEPDDASMVTVLMRRQLTDKGRSQGWINDISVTNQTLKRIGVQLIDIFAQHENQRLMEEAEHLHYLDLFVLQFHYPDQI